MVQKLPRIAAVHDVSGYGKCALTVAMPVISAMGIEVCPLPTALLSANTLFEGFTFLDFTPYMKDYVDHWKKIGLAFDAVYSGFLGSQEQMAVVARLINEFKSGISIIDPVMGDNGIVIKTYTSQMCKEMANLVAIADVTTPNITEACLLTGREYLGPELDQAISMTLCREIKESGAKSVILTGVQRGDKLYNCGITEEGEYFEIPIELLPFHMHGTGDLFSSIVVGGLVNGYSLQESVDFSAHFVYDAMVYSKDVEDAFDRGVAFEPLVYQLSKGLCKK